MESMLMGDDRSISKGGGIISWREGDYFATYPVTGVKSLGAAACGGELLNDVDDVTLLEPRTLSGRLGGCCIISSVCTATKTKNK